MRYVSTRGQAPVLDFEGVTLTGLASDGGLYLPQEWPQFSHAEIAALKLTMSRLESYPTMLAATGRPFHTPRLLR